MSKQQGYMDGYMHKQAGPAGLVGKLFRRGRDMVTDARVANRDPFGLRSSRVAKVHAQKANKMDEFTGAEHLLSTARDTYKRNAPKYPGVPDSVDDDSPIFPVFKKRYAQYEKDVFGEDPDMRMRVYHLLESMRNDPRDFSAALQDTPPTQETYDLVRGTTKGLRGNPGKTHPRAQRHLTQADYHRDMAKDYGQTASRSRNVSTAAVGGATAAGGAHVKSKVDKDK